MCRSTTSWPVVHRLGWLFVQALSGYRVAAALLSSTTIQRQVRSLDCFWWNVSAAAADLATLLNIAAFDT